MVLLEAAVATVEDYEEYEKNGGSAQTDHQGNLEREESHMTYTVSLLQAHMSSHELT